MSNRLLIAYGSNLNRKQMAHRCPTAKLLGASTLRNHRLLFRGPHAEAVATVEAMKGRSVPVLVWEITPADEATLDRYEGFPYLFEKRQLRVRLDGKLVSCMAYVMTGDHPLGKPSAFYYSEILEGYKDAGFDVDVLRTAVSESAETTED